ncbi:MAG: hypothetical protein JSV22_09415 [Bacteroidales bacterium]|nr:MAG: hypothetical protein JSV22_09415 [Bacteroidales bacterium]
MNRIVSVIFILFLSLYSFSQIEEDDDIRKRKHDEIITLIGRSDEIGGYGGLSVLYSQIDSKDAFVFGARGGLIMGHMFSLGIGGAGFVNDSHLDNMLGRNVSLAGGYGGMFFEPIILPRFPVHLSIPVLIGIGGVAYASVDIREWEEDYFVEDSETFLVAEPGIEVEMNITRFFRFTMGAYYRYTSEIELMNTEGDVLNGFSFGVNFKFGKF